LSATSKKFFFRGVSKGVQQSQAFTFHFFLTRKLEERRGSVAPPRGERFLSWFAVSCAKAQPVFPDRSELQPRSSGLFTASGFPTFPGFSVSAQVDVSWVESGPLSWPTPAAPKNSHLTAFVRFPFVVCFVRSFVRFCFAVAFRCNLSNIV